MKINRISKVLSPIVAIMLLTGLRQPTIAPKPSGIWSIPTGVGIHWKPKAEAVNGKWYMDGICSCHRYTVGEAIC